MDEKMVHPISGQLESSFVVSIIFQKLKERVSPLRVSLPLLHRKLETFIFLKKKLFSSKIIIFCVVVIIIIKQFIILVNVKIYKKY